LQFTITTRAKFHRECPIENWKRLRKCWRTRRIIFDTVQNSKLHPAGSENTTIPHLKIKLPKYHKKNCPIPQYRKGQDYLKGLSQLKKR